VNIYFIAQSKPEVVIFMMIEVTSLMDVSVFTHKGKYLGRVDNVILDITNNKIHELLITDTNSELVEASRNVGVPYRWVRSITDVIILRYFPGKIRIKVKEGSLYRRRKMRVLKREKYRERHGVSRDGWK
jgi:sporulation protein YlmC with PRC-barrel domain